MKPQPRTPHDLKPILAALSESGAILLGGQSVNIWSLIYERSNSEPWRSCRPYTSLDVDSLGERRDVVRAAEQMEKAGYAVELFFPTPDESDSPNSGKLVVRKRRFQIEIDFLHSVKGVDAQEIRAQAATLRWEGLRIRILHPLLCVESKVSSLLTLPQDDPRNPRQDRKHLILSVANLREHLRKKTRAATEEALIQTAERLIDLALHQPGLEVRGTHGIHLLDGLPWKTWAKCGRHRLRELALNEEQYRREVETRIADLAEIESWIAQLKAKEPARPNGPTRRRR